MPEIDERLLRYFAIREVERSESVARTLAGMTERERRLVREAAVMGYVQGVKAVPGGHRETFPPDADVLYQVVDACLHFDDLYPVMRSVTTPVGMAE